MCMFTIRPFVMGQAAFYDKTFWVLSLRRGTGRGERGKRAVTFWTSSFSGDHLTFRSFLSAVNLCNFNSRPSTFLSFCSSNGTHSALPRGSYFFCFCSAIDRNWLRSGDTQLAQHSRRTVLVNKLPPYAGAEHSKFLSQSWEWSIGRFRRGC